VLVAQPPERVRLALVQAQEVLPLVPRLEQVVLRPVAKRELLVQPERAPVKAAKAKATGPQIGA